MKKLRSSSIKTTTTKYESCINTSIIQLANINPVNPPKLKLNINPTIKNIGVTQTLEHIK